MKIGIIADTHGTMHPAVPRLFDGVERIVHAGDVGGKAILDDLERIAPVIAVRGNYDLEPEIQDRLLPDPSGIDLGGLPALLTHRLIMVEWQTGKHMVARLFARGPAPVAAVIFGHTHFPVLERIEGIWFINPGYCGPDPLEGPSTVAVIEVEGEEIRGEIFTL